MAVNEYTASTMKDGPDSLDNGIEQIWEEYHTKLHSFIQNRVRDESVAEDILQEVFLRIISRIDTLREDSKIQSWMYQIARNVIIDHYRAHKIMEELPESLAAPEMEPSKEAWQEIEGCLLPMIQDLPEHYREAVTLSEIEGLTQQEVAKRQGVSLSGAKSRVQRGRAMVKETLLACCRFEFDHRGKVMDYDTDGGSCEESCEKCEE
jgi:RNA polymerase sigma-70 factor (ECF subfamily)